jgi:hypothetical protein
MNDLTDETFLLFAAKHYWPVHYSITEFNSDLKRITYVKRLLKKYKKSGVLAERLILNHLILLYNVFDPTIAVNKMLFYKIDKDCYSSLKTFLIYLNRVPKDTTGLNTTKLIFSDIPIDMTIAQILREL